MVYILPVLFWITWTQPNTFRIKFHRRVEK